MRVLVIGSGAREHALLLALSRDPQVTGLIVAPGNAGTARLAEQYDVDVTSADQVVGLARKVEADLVVIGPEVPLVLGWPTPCAPQASCASVPARTRRGSKGPRPSPKR